MLTLVARGLDNGQLLGVVANYMEYGNYMANCCMANYMYVDYIEYGN